MSASAAAEQQIGSMDVDSHAGSDYPAAAPAWDKMRECSTCKKKCTWKKCFMTRKEEAHNNLIFEALASIGTIAEKEMYEKERLHLVQYYECQECNMERTGRTEKQVREELVAHRTAKDMFVARSAI